MRRNQVAVVGAAETTELGVIPNTSQIQLHADAALNAIADAGLKLSDIDGIATAVKRSKLKGAHNLDNARLAERRMHRVGGAEQFQRRAHADAVVLALEWINTALELAVSLASPERHPSAKAAKDVAAASVLLGAVVSVVVGLLLFASRILAKLSGG